MALCPLPEIAGTALPGGERHGRLGPDLRGLGRGPEDGGDRCVRRPGRLLRGLDGGRQGVDYGLVPNLGFAALLDPPERRF